MPNDTNTKKILLAIGEFAEHTERRFDKMEQCFDKMDQKSDNLEGRVENVKTGLIQIKEQMVTKDYLDEKLSEFRINLANDLSMKSFP